MLGTPRIALSVATVAPSLMHILLNDNKSKNLAGSKFNLYFCSFSGSWISDEMKSIESSDWIIYETIDNEIIGAAGIGGIFHT